MSIQSRSLVEALLAVLAIWLIVRTLPDYALTIFIDTAGHPGQLLFAAQTARVVTNVVLGALLVWQRRRISSWLSSDSGSVEVTATTVASLGSALLGIYFAAAGLITVGTYLLYPAEQQSLSRGLPWSGVVSVFIGLVLFLTSGTIARLWALLRGRGANAGRN